MSQQEYNSWWFDYYCEMGVDGFYSTPDEDLYDMWREQKEEQFNEAFTFYFEGMR